MRRYNQLREYERQQFWKTQHQQNYFKVKEHERNIERQQAIEEQRRKLAAKGIHSDKIEEYAERDIDIISGQNRGKYSMK